MPSHSLLQIRTHPSLNFHQSPRSLNYYNTVHPPSRSTTLLSLALAQDLNSGAGSMALASLLFFLAISWSPMLSSAASPVLDPREVNSLKRIAKRLGKTNWDFGVDPCSGGGNWTIPTPQKGFESQTGCDCSFRNGTLCHVTILWLKGENLSGVLPPELAQLRHLQQLDLSRSVFHGSVPEEWGSMTNLQSLSLMGNRLSGPFPAVLTKMTSLINLTLESNRFSGLIPPEIAKLVNLSVLTLSSNNFSGAIPPVLTKLANLSDLRISDTNFSGKIPDFLGKMMRLEKLHIQGCPLEGPIPSGISALTSVTDLRISDLKGDDGSVFPDVSRMSKLRTLLLRNCSLSGELPSYIGGMTTLKYFDVSFNKLTGKIPSSFANLGKVDFVYLNGNMLSGPIPQWILMRNKNVDISYNNFILGSSGPTQCLQGSVNAVESYSSAVDKIMTVPSCLKKNFPCSSTTGKYQYSLHINCGGNEVNINGSKFQADTEERGASALYIGSDWGFSSTGNFMDNSIDADSYIATNTSILSMPDQGLYTKARLSPMSLTYYGLCMMNGSYTVKIHFAEIIFTDSNTFNSLGKRLFNVFIQGKMVLENFNIEDAAGGTGKAVIKHFATFITHNTLEIQLYWAGKGTTGIPERGVYGPLVSAISVEPNFDPPPDIPPSASKGKRFKIATGAAASLFVIILVILVICWRTRQKRNSMYGDLRGLDLQTGYLSLRQIKAATKNFDPMNKIGEGGFGPVYKGLLSNGTIIAVKQLSSRSRQGNREFVNEIGMISALQHPNLVKLYGCCIEGRQLLLIYEYMENNSLARALFDVQSKLQLDWPTRRKICLGIARGLVYLHEESRLRIVHRDIKASNVLLDGELNAKISDFGLARLNEEDHNLISTQIAGTVGYMAPEYAMRGCLSDKADVYSFGVVALEIVSGKSNTNYRPKEESEYLLDWACVLKERGALLELVDPNLGSNYSNDEALLMLNVALLCTNASPTLRPTMSKVVSLLQGQIPVQPLLPVLSISGNGSSSNGIRRSFWEFPGDSQSVSVDPSITDSDETLLENDASGHLLQDSISSTN